MADNTTINAGAGGDVIATDDIGGVKHQRVKMEFGADGAAADVSATNPLPVKISDGTDTAAVDASGNVMVAVGVALDRTNVVTLSANDADRKLEMNAENSAFTNAFPVWPAKCRTAVASLTNGNHGSPTLTAAGSLWVGEKAAAGTPTYGQVSVDTTATGVQIKASNTLRRRITVINHGTTAVYIGFDTSVTSSNGALLAGVAGAQLTFYTTAQVRGITASGSQTVSYYEEVV